MRNTTIALVVVLFVCAASMAAPAQQDVQVFVPGNASGFFGNPADVVVPLVPAITVSGPGTITVTTRAAQPWVEIEVADTGCGIAEENFGRLFTPFYTTKGSGRGTGLGLSIVYGIIKMHRGQIAVKSKVGVGSAFTVTLPQRLPREGSVPKPAAEGVG